MKQHSEQIHEQPGKSSTKFSRWNSHKQMILIPALSLIIIAACNKEKTTDTPPAYHITESEKLIVPAAIDLPANMPAGNTRVATFYAEGVQKYKAQVNAGSNPVTYRWVLVAPLASLYNAANVKVGTHTAGPTWQLSAMDSIFGQQFNPPKSAPSPDPASIDWLLLMPKTGKTPTGFFAGVSYIQRIATKGGKAPVALPVSAADTIDVHYTAVYRFTKQN
ncbi:MAG TPA: DUF3455 domain-containing protein [Chitinophagaceae bacterium]